jgi:hypothetical protein
VSNAWRFAGIGCSAWQQQRAKAWTVYPRGHRGTPATDGLRARSAHAASRDRVIGQRFTDVFRLRCSQAHPGHHLIDELEVRDRSKPPGRRIDNHRPVPDIVAPLAVPPELSMALRAVPPDDTTPASLKTVSPVATRTSALETNPPEDVDSEPENLLMKARQDTARFCCGV